MADAARAQIAAARDQLRETSTLDPGLANWAAARQYAAIGWLRHQGNVTCPESIRGTAQELMWQAMKAHKKFPDSVSMIEKILARKE